MAGLVWSQFVKRYKNNLEVVYDKANNKEPVDLTEKVTSLPGNGLKFKYDTFIVKKGTKEDILKISNFKTKNDFSKYVMDFYPSTTTGITLIFAKGTTKIIGGKILKTSDFGGKDPSGKKMSTEWGQLGILQESMDKSYTLHKPTSTERGELLFINDFNRMVYDAIQSEMKLKNSPIDKECPGVNIKLGKYTFKDVVGVNKVEGTPKADLVLVACKNKKLIEVGYISHKMGSAPRDFGQWSGMTEKAGTSISNHAEVQLFVSQVKQYTDAHPEWISESGFAIGKKITDVNLRKKAVYGPNFKNSPGYDNVHAVLQGNPTLTSNGRNTYILSADGGVEINGDDIKNGFEPTFVAMKKGSYEKIIDPGASGVRSDFGIRGMRISIYTKEGRKLSMMLD